MTVITNSTKFNIIITDESTEGELQEYATNSQGVRTNLTKVVPEYDPRKRPWYQDDKRRRVEPKQEGEGADVLLACLHDGVGEDVLACGGERAHRDQAAVTKHEVAPERWLRSERLEVGREGSIELGSCWSTWSSLPYGQEKNSSSYEGSLRPSPTYDMGPKKSDAILTRNW